MNHEQLFKVVLRRFFREFLELFLPDVAARLDSGWAEFVDAELFKGVSPGLSGQSDVIARVRTQHGDPVIVSVRVEAEASTEADLGRRVFESFALLWLQFEVPVLPIVLYVEDGGRNGIDTLSHSEGRLGQEVLKFRYVSVALPRLAGREYVEKGPLGTALSSLMRWGPDSDELTLRLGLLRKVAASGLDDASRLLLADLIETYLPVPDEKREQYRRLVSSKGYREVQDAELSWADRLRQEGREEGREAGLIEGKRDTLKLLVVAKFGPLPADGEARIDGATSAAELDDYLERVLTASSLAEMGLV